MNLLPWSCSPAAAAAPVGSSLEQHCHLVAGSFPSGQNATRGWSEYTHTALSPAWHLHHNWTHEYQLRFSTLGKNGFIPKCRAQQIFSCFFWSACNLLLLLWFSASVVYYYLSGIYTILECVHSLMLLSNFAISSSAVDWFQPRGLTF